MINGMVEGVLVLYVDLLYWVVSDCLNVVMQFVIGEEGKVLYFSCFKQFLVGMEFDILDLDVQYIVNIKWENFCLVSFELVIDVYNNIFWFIFILVFVVVLIILISFYSVRVVVNLFLLIL